MRWRGCAAGWTQPVYRRQLRSLPYWTVKVQFVIWSDEAVGSDWAIVQSDQWQRPWCDALVARLGWNPLKALTMMIRYEETGCDERLVTRKASCKSYENDLSDESRRTSPCKRSIPSKCKDEVKSRGSERLEQWQKMNKQVS